jgi:hypothetical protein
MVGMARAPRRTRSLLLLSGAGLAVAVALLVAVGTVLPIVVEESPAPRATVRAAGLDEVQAAMRRATTALRDRDRAAWDAALPASGRGAGRAVDSLYRHVVRLPWTGVRVMAEPVRGRPGRFYVGVVGEIAGAEPADRIMARRVFDAVVQGGRLVLRDDVTPRDVAGQHVMAFERPVAVRRNGLVVIADKREQAAAEALAQAGRRARERLRLLGITPREPVIVYYYSSRRQLLRALGDDPDEPRIRFFSRPPDHVGETPTWTRDIGVLGPALDGKEEWAPLMLAHELTHAFTSRWFADTAHAPTLLAEGLATAVEGGRTYQPLRDDLASGDSSFPLEKALRAKSLWRGNPIAKVRLAYLEGGSLVLYVRDRWGLVGLRGFVTAVSDSDLSRKGLDGAARESVGVSWDELRAGWTAFVQTLP